MKLEDLQLVFRSSSSAPSEAQTYVVSLLNKFEVALTWDSRTLLIPSLLPSEDQTQCGLPGSDVRVKVKDIKLSFPFIIGNDMVYLDPCAVSWEGTSTEKRTALQSSRIDAFQTGRGRSSIQTLVERRHWYIFSVALIDFLFLKLTNDIKQQIPWMINAK